MMPNMEIDADIYKYLVDKSRPLEDASTVLRRLLQINKSEIVQKATNQSEQEPQIKTARKDEGRQPMARIPELIKAGLLTDGQTVYLYDYQGNILRKYEATIAG